MISRPGLAAFLLSAVAGCNHDTPSAPPSAPPTAPIPPSAAASAVGAPSVAAASPADAGVAAQAGPRSLVAKPVALPGASGPAFLDYLAYDRGGSRVWVPVGVTGSVDVLDTATGTFSRVDGFKTASREMNGKTRILGPSAVAIGEGVAYIGNRATSEVCAVDLKTLALGRCIKLPSATDGVAYVASAKEVWVTTPKDQSLSVLDVTEPGLLKSKTVVKVSGAPEGYATDESRGLFFTNLEDAGRTLAIDVKTHKVKSTWNPQCGPDGPRGLAVDPRRGFVVVACTDHVQVLDAAHDGALLGKLETGAGVDNIDYLGDKQLLYVAAGKAARLTVARLDDKGQLSVVATGATAEGARNAVVDVAGNAYVADAANARVLVFPFASP